MFNASWLKHLKLFFFYLACQSERKTNFKLEKRKIFLFDSHSGICNKIIKINLMILTFFLFLFLSLITFISLCEAPLQPLGMTGPSSTVSNGGFAAFPQSSTAPALANTQPPSQSNDKYAALADLCNVFNDNGSGGNAGTTASQSTWNISSNSSTTVPTSINWGGTGGGISAPAVTSGSGGFGFASVPTTSGAPIDWAGQTATAAPTNMNWGTPTGVAPPQSGFGNAGIFSFFFFFFMIKKYQFKKTFFAFLYLTLS